jgi:hypothetical protein
MLISDLGGPDEVSTAEAAIVRRACVLIVELELREEQFAQQEADYHKLEQYSRVAGNMRRLLESLGLKRRARDITTLGDILREDMKRQRQNGMHQP